MSNLGNHHEIEKKRNSWKIGNENNEGSYECKTELSKIGLIYFVPKIQATAKLETFSMKNDHFCNTDCLLFEIILRKLSQFKNQDTI